MQIKQEHAVFSGIIENKIPGDNSDEMPNNDNIGVNICDKHSKLALVIKY